MARVKLKHLDRGKSSHISPGKGIPSNQEGKDGDLTIRVLPNIGLKLFGKYGGKWYTIGDTFYKIIRGGGPGSLPKEPIKPSPRSNFVGNKGKLEMRDDIHLAADGLRLYLDKEKNVYISSDGTNLDLVGVLNISGDLVVGGGDISGPADGSLTLKADTDMIFQVDGDNDGTETFQFKNGAGTEILTITEDGMVTAGSSGIFTSGITITGYNNLPAGLVMNADNNDDAGDSWYFIAYNNDTYSFTNNKSGSYVEILGFEANATATDTLVKTAGKLKVGGNIIQASDGGNTITMDTSDNVTIAGDLTVSGGDIKTTGATNINVEASAHDAVGNALSITAGYPVAGTTNNIAGGSLVLAGGRGKGSGDGGHIYLKVANAGGSGSTLNSLVTAMEIEDSGNVLLTGETLQVTNTGSQKPEIKLIASGAHNKPPVLNFLKNRGGTSTSDNDYVMHIVANGYDDSNNTQVYGDIKIQCVDNTHTSEDGKLEMKLASGGLSYNALTATGTGSTVVNLSLANGATSIVDLAGHLETIADGKIYLGPNANNDYIYSDGTEINVAKDDGDVIIIKDDQTQFETPLKITESAAAVSDTAGKGQIWVKNDTPNNLYFTNDAGNDVQITNGASLSGSSPIQIASITINESDMNALHTTEQTIVAAQGASQIIMPTSCFLIVDRDASTAQSSSSCDLFISYDGSTAVNEVIYYQRRFMWNESGDRVLHLQHYTGEVAQAISDAENKPLTVKLDAAVTSGSIDSMKVVLSYHVFDNS
jgi:phage baseplate assembly protein gpV